MAGAVLDKLSMATARNQGDIFLPGSGRLVFSRVGQKTVITEMMSRSPLRLLNPGNHGTGAWVYTSSFGGGLLAGDQYDLDVRVDEKALGYLTTQASTKIYKGDEPAGQTVRVRIGKDGLFFLVPDPVVCFEGSEFKQEQTFWLDRKAGLVLVDGFTSGRLAYGETWAFRSYKNRIRILREENLVFQDSIHLDSRHGSMEKRFGRFVCFSMAVITGDMFQPACESIRAKIYSHSLGRKRSIYETCSPLDGGGLVLRFGGSSEEEVRRVLQSRLDFIPEFLGDDPFVTKY